MKKLNPIEILAASFVFLSALYLTSAVALATTLSLIVFLTLYFWVTPSILLKLGGILLLILLAFPLVGEYVSVVVGYIVFSIIFPQIRGGRYTLGLALIFLLICPVFIIAGDNKNTETLATFAYFFLAAGTIQEIINFVKPSKMIQPLI